MVEMTTIRISKWTRARLEIVKELEGHTTLDSTIKSILMFRVMSIGWQVRTGGSPIPMLISHPNSQTKSEGFEENYAAIEDEVYKDMFKDKENVRAFLDWIEKADPEVVKRVRELQKFYLDEKRRR